MIVKNLPRILTITGLLLGLFCLWKTLSGDDGELSLYLFGGSFLCIFAGYWLACYREDAAERDRDALEEE